MEVTLHDKDGNIIEPPNCSCGSKAETWIAGREAMVWKCNKCLYGESPEAKFIYKPPSEAEIAQRFPKWKEYEPKKINGAGDQ